MADVDHKILDEKFEKLVAEMATKPEATVASKSEDQRIFDAAIAFYAGGLRCLENRKNADGTTQSVTLPAIVDLAFACELFIKSELNSAGNKIQGHLLDKLYPHLAPVHRGMVEEEYESLTGRQRAQFEADLKELTKAFVNWRYIYEFKTNQHVAVHHLVAITRSMYLAASRAHPSWLVGGDLKTVFTESSKNYERVVHFSSGYMIRAIAN